MTLRKDEPPPGRRARRAGPADPGPAPGELADPGPAAPGVVFPGGPDPGPAEPGPVPAIVVHDHLARRVRRPVDLLRFIADIIQIVLVAGLGLAARAAANGAEYDILRASQHLPKPLLDILHPVAPLALLVLPVALAIRQIFRRQARQLAEAVATGILAIVVVAGINVLLRTSSAQVLYDAITMVRRGVIDLPPLDPRLAGFAAYTTIIGLSGRPQWRTAAWLTVGTYSLVSLVAAQTTVLALAITLLAGRAIGLGVRYAAGYQAQRPSAEQIALALGLPGRRITDMRRLPGTGAGSRRYAATLRDGGRLDVAGL